MGVKKGAMADGGNQENTILRLIRLIRIIRWEGYFTVLSWLVPNLSYICPDRVGVLTLDKLG